MSASSDFEQLQRVMASLQAHVQRAKINPYQCRVFQRRLRIIYDTLLRMPNKEPTPQLLSVFRAADYTFGRMGRGRWRHVLIQLFTCNAQFDCLKSRIRGVWSLHSTAMWEREDKEAMAADEDHNLGVIMTDVSLMPSLHLSSMAEEGDEGAGATAVLKDKLLHHYRRRHASQWKLLVDELQYTPALPNEDGETIDPFHSWATEEVFKTPPADLLDAFAPDLVSPITSSGATGGGSSGTNMGISPGVARNPMIDSTQLTHNASMTSPLFHNSSLLPLGDTIEMTDHFPSHSSFTAALHDAVMAGAGVPGSTLVPPPPRVVGTLAARFFVKYEGLRYRGQNVVVKRIQDAQLICPTTLEAFVMDSSVRVRWSHPNLVTTHGSFCEEFDDNGTPRLSLGMVMTNLCSAPERFVPLQRLLFLDGRRFSLLEAIDVTLQVADALQFAMFDQGDVPAYVAERWCWVSPSNVFVLDTCPWEEDTSRGGGVAAAAADITETFSIAVEDLQNAQEDVGLVETTTMQGRYAVKYSPPVFVEGGGVVSRWAPHPLAANAETYALAQLFVALTTNVQPYHYIGCQLELQSLFQAARSSPSTGTHVMPRGIVVPRTLPSDVQQFCRNAMALRTDITTGSVTNPIKTLATFRAGLHGLRAHALTLPQLPVGDPAKTSFVVQSAVDDYGWILHQPFDAHAA